MISSWFGWECNLGVAWTLRNPLLWGERAAVPFLPLILLGLATLLSRVCAGRHLTTPFHQGFLGQLVRCFSSLRWSTVPVCLLGRGFFSAKTGKVGASQVGQLMALTVRFVAGVGRGVSWRSFGGLEHNFPFLICIQREWLMVLHLTSRQRLISSWDLFA